MHYMRTDSVTGSKHLIEWDGQRVLLDCGLFQGLKELRLRNWKAPPFDPRSLDAVVLSHAHIDHSGYLPLLVKRGYRGPLYCTAGTAELLLILLPDAAHLMEEEAAYANRHGYSKHHPALPLYSAELVHQGFEQYRQNCQYCHGVRKVGASFGWDLGQPTDFHPERREPLRFYYHMRYRLGNHDPLEQMPILKHVSEEQAAQLWRWLRTVSTTPTPPYSPAR
jgi:mono/diheme cytochrome c family protein